TIGGCIGCEAWLFCSIANLGLLPYRDSDGWRLRRLVPSPQHAHQRFGTGLRIVEEPFDLQLACLAVPVEHAYQIVVGVDGQSTLIVPAAKSLQSPFVGCCLRYGTRDHRIAGSIVRCPPRGLLSHRLA